jgi:hypothetical protein
MNNTLSLAEELQAQLDNKSISDAINISHPNKLSILTKNLKYIIINNINNERINKYLEIIIESAPNKNDARYYIDKIIKNANLLNSLLYSSDIKQDISTQNIQKPKKSNINDSKDIKEEISNSDTIKKETINSKNIEPSNQIIGDIKAKDKVTSSLNITEIAKVVANGIKKLKNNSGEMIGIFGKWGRGKTYLANKIKNELEQDDNDNIDYKWVHFSAWKYSDTKQSWAYIYEILLNKYLYNKKEHWLKKYSSLPFRLLKILWHKYGFFNFLILGIFIIGILYSIFCIEAYSDFLKPLLESNYISIILFIGSLALFKIGLLYLKYKDGAKYIINKYISREFSKDILGLQAEIEKEIIIILQAWVEDDEKSKVILFVDDLDRANIKDMLQILDSLRIILDNEEIYKRLIIITAIDEELLEKSFRNKYNQCEDNLFNEYLQKIFIFGIKLHKITNDEIEEFTQNLIGLDNSKLSNTVDNNSQDNIIQNKSNLNFNNKKEINTDKELKDEEKIEIVKYTKKLNNATPRKIRIFYYKYILLKELYTIYNKKNKNASEILKNLIEIENNKNNYKDNLAKMVLLP